MAIKAPLNDVFFLQALQNYTDRIIAKSASKAFRRHLWSLSEHLAGLSLFDNRVDDTMKVRMKAWGSRKFRKTQGASK